MLHNDVLFSCVMNGNLKMMTDKDTLAVHNCSVLGYDGKETLQMVLWMAAVSFEPSEGAAGAM